MAVLTFVTGEGVIEFYGEAACYLGYVKSFGRGEGWILPSEAMDKIQRIRAVLPGEAKSLGQFLLRAGVLSEFRMRMSPEDWNLLIDALPVPEEEALSV